MTIIMFNAALIESVVTKVITACPANKDAVILSSYRFVSMRIFIRMSGRMMTVATKSEDCKDSTNMSLKRPSIGHFRDKTGNSGRCVLNGKISALRLTSDLMLFIL